MKKVLFVKNALILTATALLLRMAGIFFRVWLADGIGAEGIGLYQVIFSVYTLAATFATSGISTAVTRMVTERLTCGDLIGARRTLRVAMLLSTLIATITIALVFGFAQQIAVYLIRDARAELSLKILCISLPFMGICSCLRGYFLARRNTLSPSIAQISEQIVRMIVIVVLVGKYAKYGLAAASAAVLMGDAAAEAASTLLIWVFYRLDLRRVRQTATHRLGRRASALELLRISTPISLGRYLHTGLRTAENLLTPNCLSSYAGSQSTALTQFGMLKGMALPLLLFPASLLSSISTLLVPEMTEAVTKNNRIAIRAAVDKVFSVTSLFSFPIAGIFFTAAGPIGSLVYGDDGVGYLIRALAPLVPFMYIDLIGDGVLKGLDQQGVLLRNNVCDSVIRILLVLFLVPRFGMQGFLGVMLFSNVFTGALSVVRIVRVTELRFDTKRYIWEPLFAVILASAAMEYLCRPLLEQPLLFLVLSAVGICLLYLLMMLLFGALDPTSFLVWLARWKKRRK